MSSEPPLKLVLVTNMVAPYRVPFYNALADLADLTVVIDTESEFNRKWRIQADEYRFRVVVMNSCSLVLPRKRQDLDYSEKRQLHLSEKLLFTLKRLRPDVVISNELGLKSFQSMLYCWVSGATWILASEATEHTEGWVQGLKKCFRRFLVTKADAYWANGAETRRFLINRDANPERIMEKMTGIDSAGFRRGVLASKRESQMLRHQYGLVGRVFVFAGRLDSGKGITYLIQALGLAQESLEGRASFLIIGDGEQRTDLESCATALARIPFHFTGFIQAEELPKWFALGDVFVLPTLDDNWPLVNLEAVAGGMRQLLSKFNGGSEDLATQVGIGDVFDPRDVEIFAQHLVLALEVDTTLDEETITDLLTTYSPESQAQRALASARTALARKTVFLQ